MVCRRTDVLLQTFDLRNTIVTEIDLFEVLQFLKILELCHSV
jgi:hypothetical protein